MTKSGIKELLAFLAICAVLFIGNQRLYFIFFGLLFLYAMYKIITNKNNIRKIDLISIGLTFVMLLLINRHIRQYNTLNVIGILILGLVVIFYNDYRVKKEA